MNLYKEHNFSPASGCLTSFIQLPIIVSLYYVIREPLTYMFNMTKDQIEALVNQLNQAANGLPQINTRSIILSNRSRFKKRKA